MPLSIEQVAKALREIEKDIGKETDYAKAIERLRAIRAWRNNVLQELAYIGDKLVALESKVSVLAREK